MRKWIKGLADQILAGLATTAIIWIAGTIGTSMLTWWAYLSGVKGPWLVVLSLFAIGTTINAVLFIRSRILKMPPTDGIMYENMLWRCTEEGPKPFCPTHHAPLFYRNIVGRINSTPQGEEFVSPQEPLVCSSDVTEMFQLSRSAPTELFDLRNQVTELCRQTHGRACIEAMSLSVNIPGNALCVKTKVGYCVIFEKVSLISQMAQRRMRVRVRLRVRLQDRGTIWHKPSSIPVMPAGMADKGINLTSALVLPIEIAPGCSWDGYMAFLLTEIEWKRFAPSGLDALTGNNLILEMCDLLTGDKCEVVPDRPWSYYDEHTVNE